MSDSEQPGDRWWQFIAYRRRYVSDRTWFGAAFAVAFGAAAGTSSLFLIAAAVGAAMVVAGLSRAFRRVDPKTDGRRSAPPW